MTLPTSTGMPFSINRVMNSRGQRLRIARGRLVKNRAVFEHQQVKDTNLRKCHHKVIQLPPGHHDQPEVGLFQPHHALRGRLTYLAIMSKGAIKIRGKRPESYGRQAWRVLLFGRCRDVHKCP